MQRSHRSAKKLLHTPLDTGILYDFQLIDFVSAPELFQKLTPSIRSDLYSTIVLLFKLLNDFNPVKIELDETLNASNYGAKNRERIKEFCADFIEENLEFGTFLIEKGMADGFGKRCNWDVLEGKVSEFLETIEAIDVSDIDVDDFIDEGINDDSDH